jgi:hypothetical protein
MSRENLMKSMSSIGGSTPSHHQERELNEETKEVLKR